MRTLTTDREGFYTATSLPLGTYTVKVEAPGFKTDSVTGLVLHVNDTLTVNRKLSVGSANQQVSVEAEAVQLNFQDASSATLVSGTQVRELALNNRNYEQLVALQPGVSYGGGDQLYIGLSNPSGETNTVSFSVNGNRNSSNNWTLDGADNVDRGSNLTLLAYPSVDAIAEFKTQRGTFSAEYGRSASGQINVITRSGTNAFHGTAYEFFRNNVLNANSYLNNKSGIKRPVLRYNDFGYTLGGPVWIPKVYDGRNKTFFFFSQELRRVITYSQFSNFGVPTLAERQGNFGSSVVCASVNSTTGKCNDAGTTQISPTSFSPMAQGVFEGRLRKCTGARRHRWTYADHQPAEYLQSDAGDRPDRPVVREQTDGLLPLHQRFAAHDRAGRFVQRHGLSRSADYFGQLTGTHLSGPRHVYFQSEAGARWRLRFLLRRHRPNIPNTSFDNPAAGTAKLNTNPIVLHSTAVNFSTPYSQQFSLDLQQQLAPNFVLDVGYFGDLDRHLIGIVDMNEVPVGAYLAAGLGSTITGDSVKRINTGNTPTLNQIRPYKGYNALNTIEPWFTSNYNSLQVSLQKRFSGKSLIDVNYTWSRALTDAQSDRSTAPQNTYDIKSEYGRSALDRNQILTADFVYELPFMQNQSGVVGRVVGGWEVSGIVSINSGLPFTATISNGIDPGGLGFLGASAAGPRPDQISDPNSGPGRHTFLHWFNTTAFAPVPSGQVRPGNARRGTINGPGFQRWDLSLFKNFKVTEGSSFQFRAESFNTFNHTNFDSISTSTTAGVYGQVIATRDPRIMQVGLKFNF